MTHLIERITVTVTLHRDKADRFPYDHLWETLRRIWPQVCPWMNKRGYINMHNIEIEWKSDGLEEVAEATGSDN